MNKKNRTLIINIVSILLIILAVLVLLPCAHIIKEKFMNRNKDKRILVDSSLNTFTNNIFDTNETYDISNSYMDSEIIKNTIPKTIFQTQSNDTHQQNNISTYAPEYKYLSFTEKEIIDFIESEYNKTDTSNLLNKFKLTSKTSSSYSKKINNLFKYSYLYKYGGVYIGNDILLARPLNQILNRNYLYGVIGKNNKSIHQGLIASAPKNPLFQDAINHILTTCEYDELMMDDFMYKLFTIRFRKHPAPGLNKISGFYHVYLFEEHCEIKNKNMDNNLNPLQTNNTNCVINDFNLPIAKTN